MPEACNAATTSRRPYASLWRRNDYTHVAVILVFITWLTDAPTGTPNTLLIILSGRSLRSLDAADATPLLRVLGAGNGKISNASLSRKSRQEKKLISDNRLCETWPRVLLKSPRRTKLENNAVAASFKGTTMVLSAGYVMWILRGAMLVASAAATLRRHWRGHRSGQREQGTKTTATAPHRALVELDGPRRFGLSVFLIGSRGRSLDGGRKATCCCRSYLLVDFLSGNDRRSPFGAL